MTVEFVVEEFTVHQLAFEAPAVVVVILREFSEQLFRGSLGYGDETEDAFAAGFGDCLVVHSAVPLYLVLTPNLKGKSSKRKWGPKDAKQSERSPLYAKAQIYLTVTS